MDSRGTPQGFAAAIFLIRAAISALTAGRCRPGGVRRVWLSGGESGVAASAARWREPR
jgi:hypothetical protein